MATGGEIYSLGYEVNRFEIVVSKRFHCPICFQVLKDPVMCENQHCYCSPCIKKYLENKASCPTCRVPLSVDTLSDAPTLVRDYLSELNIRCDFYDRGCREMVQVGQLKRHVANCGFFPVPCSNGECNVVVNKRDKLHHQAEVCDFRRLKYHDCSELKKEVKEVKEGVMEMKEEMRVELKNEMKGMQDEMKKEMTEMKVEMKNEVKEVKTEMKVMIDRVFGEHDKMKKEIKKEVKEMKDEIKVIMQDEVTKNIKEEIKNEIKREVNEMKEEIRKEVKEVVLNAMREGILETKNPESETKNSKQSLKATCSSEAKANVVVAEREREEGLGQVRNKSREKVQMEERVVNEARVEMAGEKDSLKATCSSDEKANVVVAGGEREGDLVQVWNKLREKLKMKERVVNEARVKMAGKKGSSNATCSSEARGNIFVAGGYHIKDSRVVTNKLTECFNWADQTWIRLNSAALEGRSGSCSFLYRGQMVVAGGRDGVSRTNTVKCLNLADPAATWKDFHVNLPVKCSGPKAVHCDDRLYMSGGWVQATDGGVVKCSDAVYEVQFVPPFSSKMLTSLRRPRSEHGMELYDEKLFILGGHDSEETTSGVVQYDLIKNECKEMPPLPYAVQEMATVLWRNNVLVLGGEDARYNALNTVVMYDVITGRSQMLPCMKHPRHGCTAVLTGNVVVVMGGMNECDEYLKSVECFDLERQVWQDLPDMLEGRAFATAVVKPNH